MSGGNKIRGAKSSKEGGQGLGVDCVFCPGWFRAGLSERLPSERPSGGREGVSSADPGGRSFSLERVRAPRRGVLGLCRAEPAPSAAGGEAEVEEGMEVTGGRVPQAPEAW